MNSRLKRIIFDKLYADLKHVEIIPYKGSIWFIDREKKCWYFELKKSGCLWWCLQFFPGFFKLFSLEYYEYEPLLSEWVEGVLNCKVWNIKHDGWYNLLLIEEILTYKVKRTNSPLCLDQSIVEKVLNYEGRKITDAPYLQIETVMEILNLQSQSK